MNPSSVLRHRFDKARLAGNAKLSEAQVMKTSEQFVDLYAVLRVHPQCDAKTLEAAYRDLAKTYHPDHSETGDTQKFQQILKAYRALKSAAKRAAYDTEYSLHTGFVFDEAEATNDDDKLALSDSDAHHAILMRLYRQRREFAQAAGVGQFELQRIAGCSEQALDFHIWYLKEKKYITYTEEGTLAITIEGVDYILTKSHS
jgi:curved DNA-binding protein